MSTGLSIGRQSTCWLCIRERNYVNAANVLCLGGVAGSTSIALFASPALACFPGRPGYRGCGQLIQRDLSSSKIDDCLSRQLVVLVLPSNHRSCGFILQSSRVGTACTHYLFRFFLACINIKLYLSTSTGYMRFMFRHNFSGRFLGVHNAGNRIFRQSCRAQSYRGA